MKGLDNKVMKVTAVGPVQIPSFTIGILQPFNYLNKAEVCRFEAVAEERMTGDAVIDADLVIFYRTIRPETYRFLELAHELGKRTVYAIDDHFMAMPPTIGIGRFYADPLYRQTFTKFLKNCQLIRVASNYFAEHIRTHFNPNVVYFPSSVDFSLLQQVKKPTRDDDQIVIGYEGARKDAAFAPVVPALLDILDKYGEKVKLEFYGYVPKLLEDHPNVSYVPPEPDYKKFMQKLYQATWDIGLAPLEDTLFHRCKTNNKFREYAACWIPGIYSDSPVYRDWVKHKETGYVVSHKTDAWYSAIRRMIEHPELRRRIKERAGKMARHHFTVERCAEHWKRHVLKS